MQNSKFRKSLIGLAVIGALSLSACGGGGSSSSTSSGSLTSGVITGFGSVFVNGVEYETNGADILVNGVASDESALEVGMVVNLRGTANGASGSALSIEYKDELQGIVQQNDYTASGTLKVMGLTVRIDSATVFESKVASVTGFDTIQTGNIVEVSGHRLDANTIQATLVEVKKASHSGDEIEVKGAISNLNLTANTFLIGTLVVDYSAVASIPAGGLSEGLFVEVKSTQGVDSASGNLIASSIELESNGDAGIDGDEGEEIELSGPIGINPTISGFSLNGTPVVIDSTTEFEHGAVSAIAEGVQVKVEGTLNGNGELVAKDISFNEASETELQAALSAVDVQAGTITIMGQTISVDATTLLKDDSSNAVRYFGLDDLAADDRLEVSFYKDDTTGKLVAVKLQREDNGSDKLAGSVESVSISGTTLVVGGVTVDITGLASSAPTVGTKVEIRGNFDSGTGQLNASSLSIDS